MNELVILNWTLLIFVFSLQGLLCLQSATCYSFLFLIEQVCIMFLTILYLLT